MDAHARLLVVDDDPHIRTMLREYLERHGYGVAEAANGEQLRQAVQQDPPAVVLLDIGLPGEDGLVLARFLRERYDLGVIMVTASCDVVDRVIGLEVGADDYIAKPFDLRELLARIKSVLRRTRAVAQDAPRGPIAVRDAGPPRQRFGRCEVDLESHRMWEVGGPEVALTAMEYELVATFLANPNRVLTRDQLLLRTRNREWGPFDRSIDIRIGRLRRKVEPDPSGEPRCIRTVRNAGYMYVPNHD